MCILTHSKNVHMDLPRKHSYIHIQNWERKDTLSHCPCHTLHIIPHSLHDGPCTTHQLVHLSFTISILLYGKTPGGPGLADLGSLGAPLVAGSMRQLRTGSGIPLEPEARSLGMCECVHIKRVCMYACMCVCSTRC